MTLTAPPLRPRPILARAQSNYHSNLAVLPFTPPPLAQDLEYLLARDASLTALLPDGSWHAGCSLPRRAAEAMLKTFTPTGPVALFLAPPTAHAIAVAIEKLAPNQVVIAVLPDESDLPVFLHCHDFSEPIRAHQLYFLTGPSWSAQLTALLNTVPGLPTPTYLIKIPATDDIAAPLVPQAQQLIEQQTARRAQLLDTLRTSSARSSVLGPEHFCLLAPQHFRLWSTPGRALARLFPDHTLLNPDDPATSSPLALATAARNARALLSADLARADLPATLPDPLPWITWVTIPRVPKFTPAAPRDALLLADPAWQDLALKSGWPQHRLAIATWPHDSSPSSILHPSSSSPSLAMIADTAIIPPAPATDYSSHRLLWEAIRDELAENPLVAYTDVNAYLADRMARLAIRPDGFDHAAFLSRLIIPAYTQSLARLILRANFPLRLYGTGWPDLEEFRPHAQGPLPTEDVFNDALSHSTLLIHPYPSPHLHPADFTTVPNHRPTTRTPAIYLQSLRNALSTPPPRPQAPPFTPAVIESLLPN